MPVHRLMDNSPDGSSGGDVFSDLRVEAGQLQRLCTCPLLEDADTQGQLQEMEIDPTEATSLNVPPQHTRELIHGSSLSSSRLAQEDQEQEEYERILTLLGLCVDRDRKHLLNCPCHLNSPMMSKFSRRVKEHLIRTSTLSPKNEEQSEHRTQQSMLSISKQLSGPSDPFAPTRRPSTQTRHLYPGSRFRGKQRSKTNSYDVMVDIKHVDLNESFLCGYLHIQGLTEEYPELTTYFEAEMIGPKYSFLTRKWDADECTDEEHWTLFKPFEKLANSVFSGHAEGEEVTSEEDHDDGVDDEDESEDYDDERNMETQNNEDIDEVSDTDAEYELDDEDYNQNLFSHAIDNDEEYQCPHHPAGPSSSSTSESSHLHRRRRRHSSSNQYQHVHQRKRRRHLDNDRSPSDFRNEDVVFMRWKEHFLVPDHRVQGISGASFAGFYYICYNKTTGQISGYYYHHASERFQNLLLSHEEERSFASYEFR